MESLGWEREVRRESSQLTTWLPGIGWTGGPDGEPRLGEGDEEGVSSPPGYLVYHVPRFITLSPHPLRLLPWAVPSTSLFLNLVN